jgi:two-component system NtrC family sensor kinase
MSTLSHSVISFYPVPKTLSHLDISTISIETKNEIEADVIIASLRQVLDSRFGLLWSQIRNKNSGTQLILIVEDPGEFEVHFRVHRSYPVFRIFENAEEPEVEWAIFEAVERSQWIHQNEQLQILVRDQFDKLKNLSQELEDRVQKRQKYLEESRRKNLIAQFRWQTLRRATETIHESSSIGQMEEKLTEVLQETLNLVQVRLLLHNQSSMAQPPKGTETFATHRVRLFQDQDVLIGFAVFFRDLQLPYSSDEKDFLQKISEAISLAVRRLNQLEITRTLREQWQATFNAVHNPIALISSNYDVVQTNSAFLSRIPHKMTTAKKCYSLLFDRESPCPHCQLGKSFRVDFHKPKNETWEVSSQFLHLGIESDQKVYLNQYQDITEKLRLEARLVQAAKLAELGIIGSSIAHELNNPLGGILSFVQMMRMDLKENDPIKPDILEMEAGVLRCRDIVQNLLGFTRSPQAEVQDLVDLRDPINTALGLVELQTRSQGITVRSRIPKTALIIQGNANLLSQAFTNVLQNALESVKNLSTKSSALIEIIVHDVESWYEVQILDNGPGQELAPSLTIPLAQQILIDHQAELEIFQPRKGLRTVKILIPKFIASPEIPKPKN